MFKKLVVIAILLIVTITGCTITTVPVQSPRYFSTYPYYYYGNYYHPSYYYSPYPQPKPIPYHHNHGNQHHGPRR